MDRYICHTFDFSYATTDNSTNNSLPKSNTLMGLACVASVPVRAKCFVSRASEDSSRAKIGARAKKGKERGGGGGARERLQANPTILKNPFAHERGF